MKNRELGNPKRCVVCSFRWGRPFDKGERLIGFDHGQILDAGQRERTLHAYQELLAPLIVSRLACIHGSRISIRGPESVHRTLGQAFRAKAREMDAPFLNTFADLLLEEGPLHPSRVRDLTPAELETL